MPNKGLAVSDRDSSCIRSIVVNPTEQTAHVAFKHSDVLYKYRNVPTAECLRLINDKDSDISLGQWVNQVLKQPNIFFTTTSFGY